MSDYSINFKPSVEKDLRKVTDSHVSNIMKRIERLVHDPFPVQSTKLTGTQKTYRVRIRDYRIIYEVDKARKMITVLYVRHRRDVYRDL